MKINLVLLKNRFSGDVVVMTTLTLKRRFFCFYIKSVPKDIFCGTPSCSK
jgi:hypothetical protein